AWRATRLTSEPARVCLMKLAIAPGHAWVAPIALRTLATDQDGHCAQRDHALCLAPKHPLKAPAPMRCHHDQVASPGARRLDNGLRRKVSDVHGFAIDLQPCRRLTHPSEDLAGTTCGGPLEILDWEIKGGRIADRHGRPWLCCGHCADAGAQSLGKAEPRCF